MSNAALTSRLAVLRAAQKFPEPVIAALAQHVSEAPEEALYRMSPVRYAKTANIPEQMAIDLFLHATRAGLLEFTWGMLCPACHGFITTEGALRALNKSGYCSLCDVVVKVDEDMLEVAFTVAPSVRHIRFHKPEALEYSRDAIRLFFSSSVAWDPGVVDTLMDQTLTSGVLPANASATFPLKLEPGQFSLVAPVHHAWAHFSAKPGGPSVIEVDITDGAALPRLNEVGLGDVKITLHNRLPAPSMFGFMRMPESFGRTLLPFLTGKRLVTTQAFRDLFRAESIPAASGMQLKSLTLLFTDLKGSTEMYERIGDLRAFDLVRQHFGVLQEIIASRGGAMVKTIGDAIMASFPESEPALEAALAMNRDIQKVGKPGEMQLKIGMHSGPCIAVDQNDRLDYFGQTVNIAARVQNVAAANEVALTDPVLFAPRSKDILKGFKLHTTKESLKGVDGLVTVHHVT